MPRWSIFLCCLYTLIISGCTKSYVAIYDIGLVEAKRPPESKERFGEQVVRITTELGSRVSHFRDGLVSIAWQPDPLGIRFDLTNQSDESIEIDWEACAYVDEGGVSHRIVHSSIEAAKIDRPQATTKVARGDEISDVIRSVDKISFEAGIHGRWHEEPLFPATGSDRSKLTAQAEEYEGKTVDVVLAFTVERKTIMYRFIFGVERVEVKEKRRGEEM
jgi:hypothetical protein